MCWDQDTQGCAVATKPQQAQTSVCSGQSCRGSGIMPKTTSSCRHITASSGLHVWWTCDQCPCGCAHEWLATVSNRQDRHSQCPFCTNHRLCQHNSLLTVAPAVAAYWDSDKNGLTPDQVMASSSTRRHWLCPACGHSWQAMIYGKVMKMSGCPKCSKKSHTINRQPSLTQSGHPAMMEFDFERNQRAGLDPDKITAGSGKMVHWICT